MGDVACPACSRVFAEAAIHGHRARRRPRADGSRNENPCAFTEAELAERAEDLRTRKRLKARLRPDRTGRSLEEHDEARRADPERTRRRLNEAHDRWAAAHPERALEAKRRWRRRQRRARRRRAYGTRWRRLNPTYWTDRRGTTGRARRVAAPRPSREPLAPLFPHLQRGSSLAFWEDELRMDLEQERALAELEGRDPARAAAEYRAREKGWQIVTTPLTDAHVETIADAA